jgi:DNA-binding MarR family transcriptional regulator
MLPSDLSTDLVFFDALTRSETTLWRRVEEGLRADHAGSLADLTVLRVIAAFEPRARVADVVDTIGITVGASSKAVDRLEAAGLTSRAPDPNDRRSSLITLTPGGQEALTAGIRSMRRTLRPLLEAAAIDMTEVSAALNGLLAASTTRPLNGARR